MNIDNLIEELINLKDSGVKNVIAIDPDNKDYNISFEMNGESDLAFMIVERE